MEETLNNNRLIDVIKIISAQGETGRLQIRSGTTRGAFFFKKGKLVDARMGTLSGFPALNAAVSVREASFTFDSSISPPASTFNNLSERMVLKRLFGIETMDPAEGNDQVTVAGDELAFTRSGEVLLSDVSDPKWSASDPQNDAHKPTQDVSIGRERELETLEESEDLVKGKATGEAHRMAEDTHGLIEDEARKRLKERKGGIIAEQTRPVQIPSLAVTLESSANETPKDSEKKFCPTCNRSYSDDSLNYCLDDGAHLSASPDPEDTLVPHNSKPPGTISHPLLQSSPSSYRRGLYVALLLLLMGTGALILLLEFNKRRLPASAVIPSESSRPLPTQVSKQVEQKRSGAQNLTGQWKVVNIVEKTSYRSFTNLEIGFRLRINQTGTDFTAEGEKISENGRILPSADRTPIRVTGSIDGERVEATFVEEGVRRKTRGRFVWVVGNAGAGLTGTFVSTAARTSGTSAATKEL